MSLFRSEQMGYFSLIASREYVWEIFNEIGELDSLQFIDLNAEETSFNRPFSNFVKRCEEMEIKIKSVEDYINKFGKKVIRCEDYKEFLRNLRFALASRQKSERTYLDEMEHELNEQMIGLAEQIKSYEELVDRYNHLVEFREVLNKTRSYVQDSFGGPNEPAFESGFRRDIRFTYLAGVINKEDSLRFRRILFRITRGMAWTSLMDIEPGEQGQRYFIDSAKVDSKPKTVFLIIYQGGEHQMLQQRLNRICDSFGASKYGVPEDANSLSRKLMEVENQIKDAQEIVRVTRGHLETVLDFYASPGLDGQSYSHIEGLKLFVLKEKSVYHNLNMLRPQMHIYQGNCWCPLENVHRVRESLSDLARRKGDMGGCEFREALPPAGVSPPTAFKTNSFTSVFQEIVNTYGIPRYREINPGLFTIATFPFLFGVMFGDIIHGALLCIAGLYMCFWKDKIEKDKDSLWKLLLPARYILTMQGFFAFYCGLIYNDMTSIPLDIFGTCYSGEGELTRASNCTYGFGLDPSWYGTTNELTFINSFKMKLAIVLGVTHMLFGILLRGLNNIFTRKWLDFIFEFVPMLIFMSVTFGYMVFLIFLKWSIPWGVDGDYNISNAPSIINIFIKMALSPGSWDLNTLGTPLYGDDSGNFQASLQLVFLLAALICALLILLPKPLILRAMHKKRAGAYEYAANDSDFTVTQNLLENSHAEDNQVLIEPQVGKQKEILKKAEHGELHAAGEHFDMSEIFVHQVIETIEFVLGSISNTASYLRLWALSLAHSQLSKVFFVNSLGSALSSGNLFMAFFSFWIFANISLGVLLLMDQMECFLHALRLHWVEFQNKFYKADGYAFEPFSFEKSFKKFTSN